MEFLDLQNILINNPYKYRKYIDDILLFTIFLDNHYDNVSMKQRLFHIKNNDLNIHSCPMCDKNARWTDNWKYVCCSKECTGKLKNNLSEEKLKNKIDRTKNTNIERYGVISTLSLIENPMKSEEIKARRLERMKKKYGDDFNWQFDSKIQNTIDYAKSKYENCNLTYIKFLGHKYHLLKCNICGYEFKQLSSTNNRIRMNESLCPICNPNISTISFKEKQIVAFVKAIYSGEIIENTQRVIKPFEIDIFLPEISTAIEFNGDYYHMNPKIYKETDTVFYKTAKEIWEKDLKKKKLCGYKGIKLITIWEKDWIESHEEIKKNILEEIYDLKIDKIFDQYFMINGLTVYFHLWRDENKQKIYKSLINHKNNLSTKIFARKCEIREIQIDDYKKFCDENHLQGYISASIKIGLFFENELVSILSFSYIKGIWNCQRYCTKLNHQIIGGFSKMLSYFEKTYKPIKILSYSSKDISQEDNVYRKNGFILVGESNIGYCYIDKISNITYSRQQFQKHKLIYVDVDKELTEEQLVNKYFPCLIKVLNKGNLKFIKTVIFN